MAPRPRKDGRQGWPPGLGCKRNASTGASYYTWTNPLTGSERSLKCPNDFATACKRAKQANALIAQRVEDRALSGLLIKKTTLAAWCERYLKLIESRKLRENTMRSRRSLVRRWVEAAGNEFLETLQTKTLSAVIDAEVERGHSRQAVAMLSVITDVINMAKSKGEFPSAHANPADAIKPPTVKVQRSRFTLDDFNALLAVAAHPWERHALLLALVTGQGREDIALAQFRRAGDWDKTLAAYIEDDSNPMPPSYVDGDFFYATRQKTGALIQIPLALRLDAIGLSVGDVVSKCRGTGTVSRYLVHHTVSVGFCKAGEQVHKDTLSRLVARLRKRAELTWSGKKPPTFHEIRSLSERLYRAQGVDTKVLLGHSEQKMTDLYNSERGPKWSKLEVAK